MIECSKNWYEHKAKSIEENEKTNILWDVTIQTDRVIEARRPDIVVIDKANKTCQIIDIAVPSDQNITKKEKEKIDKYQELKLEIMRMWSVQAWVVPIVVGALCCTTKKLGEYLKNIGHSSDKFKLTNVCPIRNSQYPEENP